VSTVLKGLLRNLESKNFIVVKVILYNAACGIFSHKNCRNQIQLTCIIATNEGDATTGIEHGSEKLRIVQEKLVALQREVNIELKIHEGLEKITKAKSEGQQSKSKIKKTEKDINTQLEKNNNRLEALKHEMQKRTIQLHALQKVQHDGSDLSKKKAFAQSNENGSTSSVTNLPLMDTGLLRVIVVDPITKSEFKKAIYIPENQSTVEVIEMILNKANLSGAPNSYQLTCKMRELGIISLTKKMQRF
jgi:hypothetical protein